MRFAGFTFIGAGIWGTLVLLPLHWLVDITGRVYSPPTDYPHCFYGFLSVAMASANRVSRDRNESDPVSIADDPEHPRETRLHKHRCGVVREGAHSRIDAQTAGPDRLLAILFAVALLKTQRASG